VIVAALALLGLFGVLPVSLAELSAGGACPRLGVLPACHLVSLAYGTVLVTVLHRRLWNPWVFLLAWLPIFSLAAMGSSLELLGHGTCPKTDSGLPKCFLSLALAVALFLPFLVHFAKSMRIKVQRS
jgi:hypothetical protein